MTHISIKKEDIDKIMKIPLKIQQVDRIYVEIYKRRADYYKELETISYNETKKKWLPKRKVTNTKDEIVTELKNLNKRERRIITLLLEGKEELDPYKEYIGFRWALNLQYLNKMNKYFEDILADQIDFLEKELQFLDKKITREAFIEETTVYYSKLDDYSVEIKALFKQFYSPSDVKHILEKFKDSSREMHDLFAYVTIFVAFFSASIVFRHSIPESQFFNAKLLPDPQTFMEYVLICVFLMKSKIIENSFEGYKKYLTKATLSLKTITW